jgi:hypothetical protein
MNRASIRDVILFPLMRPQVPTSTDAGDLDGEPSQG